MLAFFGTPPADKLTVLQNEEFGKNSQKCSYPLCKFTEPKTDADFQFHPGPGNLTLTTYNTLVQSLQGCMQALFEAAGCVTGTCLSSKLGMKHDKAASNATWIYDECCTHLVNLRHYRPGDLVSGAGRNTRETVYRSPAGKNWG